MFFIFAFGDNYWQFAIAYLIMGISSSFSSGTGEAFLYDTLLNLKEKNRFMNIFIVLFFKEPERAKINKNLLEHTFASFKIFRKNKKLLMLSLFSIITVSAIVISFFLIQQYYEFIGIPVALI